MKKLWLLVVSVLVALTLTTTLPIAYTQDYTTWGLPEGAKARLGKGGVWAAQYSPDHKYLAAAGSIGIWLYDASTYEELSLLTGHTGIVTSVAFSPNGEILASGSEDYTIGLWDVQTGTPLHVLTGHTGWVEDVAFSPDGRTLASAGGYYNDHTVRLWDVQTGTLRHTLTKHTDDVWCVAFSPDGKTLASGSEDATVRLWDVQTGTLQDTKTIETVPGGVTGVAFSPNGRLLASAGWGGTHIWYVETGELIADRSGSGGFDVAFSPNGRLLASGHGLAEVDYERLDLPEWRIPTSLGIISGFFYPYRNIDYNQPGWSASFSPNGDRLATVAHDATIRVWQVVNIELGWLRHTITHTYPVTDVAFSPDGKTLANGTGDLYTQIRRAVGPWNAAATIPVWDVETGELQHTVTTVEDSALITSVAFSSDGWTLASGSWGSTVHVWNAETGQLLDDYRFSSYSYPPIYSIAYNPGYGSQLAIGNQEGVYAWVPTIQSSPRPLTVGLGEAAHVRNVKSVAFSPDGEYLASGNSLGAILLWAMPTGVPLPTLTTPTTGAAGHEINSLAFGQVGGKIVLASGTDVNGNILLWEVADGLGNLIYWPGELVDGILKPQPKHTLRGHGYYVYGLAFSPGGGTLASGSWDKTVRLWNTYTGEHKRTLIGHTRDVNSVAFSPDGELLASGSADGTVLLWRIRPEPKRMPADVNNDGVVNIQDLVLVSRALGLHVPNGHPADVNGDGKVNIQDLVEVAGAIGPEGAAP